MNDLISRQAAIDAFMTELTKRERKNLLHTWSTVEVKYFVVDMLEKSPSVQPEIMRCKDCKHYQVADNRAFGCPGKRCEWTGFEDVDDDDFCSRGERKTTRYPRH